MKKKYALVTGASGDIGSAIALQLAQHYYVYVHANNNKAKANEIVAEIEKAGGEAEAVFFDITDAEATTAALNKLTEKAAIQIIVNNAGIYKDVPMAGMSHPDWHDVMDVTLNGFYHVTQPLLMPMIKTRWGRIITISSISGVKGNRGQANYAAAKAGVIGATKSLALELASRGITANVIAPGIIEGKSTEKIFDNNKIAEYVPMQRAGKPEEVAYLVEFLASDKAAYISGQVIGIDGAMT